MVSSYNVVFEKSFSSVLAYTSQPYIETISMKPAVSYIPYATSLREQTGDIVTFAWFEEGILLS